MGRTVIIEESVENYISSLYGIHKWQIGLIIGQVKLKCVPVTCAKIFSFRYGVSFI